MPASTVIHLAIPAMNEADYLPQTISCINKQAMPAPGPAVRTWICVNQPEPWWHDNQKKAMCQNNRRTLDYLQTHPTKDLTVIDRSSRGKGWTGRDHGVGMARKVLMDAISEAAADDHIMVSMDADTQFGPGYLHSIATAFNRHPQAVALSNPYYHRLTGEENLDRAMLRYEIYMRYYAINMWRIGSPYSFTALGSAIALPVWAYRKIGGITAKKSGEDFYLLQKLRKTGWIIHHNHEKVFPATRFSDRVFFGTGPALIKGSQGQWQSYPIYDYNLFDKVKQTYELFPMLHQHSLITPIDGFLKSTFGNNDIFEPLRKNAKDTRQFVRACHHKIDGLRVLQFLKSNQSLKPFSDENNLICFLQAFFPGIMHDDAFWNGLAPDRLDFKTSDIGFLNKIRNFLLEKEEAYQMAGQQLVNGI